MSFIVILFVVYHVLFTNGLYLPEARGSLRDGIDSPPCVIDMSIPSYSAKVSSGWLTMAQTVQTNIFDVIRSVHRHVGLFVRLHSLVTLHYHAIATV
ncbi:hypothetical protein EWM64_g5517 [Hericium alpestre]|uniref:Secreted protein n=1 Tax=Hericium alpestre TaxID=135208 RepID=A0A4Y9ZV99_9AGAM|nr:hypothetical protein EWM64_g5517 [Hericium alpestre]